MFRNRLNDIGELMRAIVIKFALMFATPVAAWLVAMVLRYYCDLPEAKRERIRSLVMEWSDGFDIEVTCDE